jgi:hypothetical protein
VEREWKTPIWRIVNKYKESGELSEGFVAPQSTGGLGDDQRRALDELKWRLLQEFR